MGVLNFSTDKLITGVNIIDGNLYWTDDNSEPKKLEIDRFRDYDSSGMVTRIDGEEFIESDLSVIRLHPWEAITLETSEYVETTEQPEPPFERIFPRFSYRWVFEDGQVSPYAPFTQAAFIPKTRVAASTGTRGEDDFVPNTEEANYIEGFNTSMFNNVGAITLNNIPRGPRDVVSVELLYTESISSTIYVLETLDIPEAQRGLDYVLSPNYTTGVPARTDYSLLPLSYELSARKIYSALPANQLSRPYDEVPQRALAQEITANRLIYGNYKIGFDQPTNVSLDSQLVTAGPGDGLHVKGNRTYEVGVAYIDAYGRQGAMIQAGSITADDGTITEQIPLVSPFNQTTRQQIQSTITSAPPSWADRYRYFIKDVSMDHQNLKSYNIYNDGAAIDNSSEFIWIEFQSTDRNKVQEESGESPASVLSLRRTNDTIAPTKQRFLVQDIQNEAPEDVRLQIREVLTNVSLSRTGSFSDNNRIGGSYNGPLAEIRTAAANNALGSTTLSVDANGNSEDTRNLFQASVVDQINMIVRRLQPETQADQLDELFVNNFDAPQPHIDLDFSSLTSPVYVRFRTGTSPNTYLGGEFSYVQVTAAGNGWFPGAAGPGDSQGRGIYLTLGGRFMADVEGEGLSRVTDAAGEQLQGLPGAFADMADYTAEFHIPEISDSATERLGGRFWVRAARNGLATAQSEFTFEGELVNLQQFWFETEPIVAESQLDLFWETSDTFCVCTEHGWPNNLEWFNSIAEATTGGVYLETTRIFDQFNSVQLVKGVRVNVPTDRSSVIERPYGLTWSGIYNSRTSINRLNQFITADGITKELEPNYGSLQKLHTRDTNLIAACEDKFFRILADKDQLFNADGGGNVSATNAVLGQTTPFVGEYGISRNPESFASYGHNFWCTDANRGVVLQITPGNGQVHEINSEGLDDFFRDRLFSADRIVGMYDDYTDAYTLSLQGYDQMDTIIADADRLPGETSDITVKYETSVKGFPAFLDFIPESGLTLNNKFYTWKNGLLYMHNSNTEPRNNFYGTQYESIVEVIFNDSPSSVKEFLALNYEGTGGWEVMSIETDQDTARILQEFRIKEGKYYQAIVTDDPVYVWDTDTNAVVDSGTTQLKGGAKGFYAKVTMRNTSTTPAELFAVSSEVFQSSL